MRSKEMNIWQMTYDDDNKRIIRYINIISSIINVTIKSGKERKKSERQIRGEQELKKCAVCTSNVINYATSSTCMLRMR